MNNINKNTRVQIEIAVERIHKYVNAHLNRTTDQQLSKLLSECLQIFSTLLKDTEVCNRGSEEVYRQLIETITHKTYNSQPKEKIFYSNPNLQNKILE